MTIRNELCPYCTETMNEVPNDPRKSSREHLVAERFFQKRRGMGEADFLCCKQCNEDKSEMDYVFAAVSRLQSNRDISLSEANNVLKDDKKFNRFVRVFRSMQAVPQGLRAEFPASAKDILEYLDFLAKGHFFLKTGRLFQNSAKIFIPDMYCRGVLDAFDRYYKGGKGNKFDDLRTNPNSEILGEQNEVIVWSKGMQFEFVLNDTIVVGGAYVENTKTNDRKRQKHISRISKSDGQRKQD